MLDPMSAGSSSDLYDLAGVPLEQLPLALAGVHGRLAVGTSVRLVFERDPDTASGAGARPGPLERSGFDPAGAWSVQDVVIGAGFSVSQPWRQERRVTVLARRERTLADRVAPGMRLLVCGLNPSEYAADRGVPFARPGNRFWSALAAAGLGGHDRDPDGALADHGIGFTDLAKRATRRAAELRPEELRDGAGRVERLVRRLRPAVVCFLGVTGYRTGVDRTASGGLQPGPFAGRPVFVLGNPSGLNAHTDAAALAVDLRRAWTYQDDGTCSDPPGGDPSPFSEVPGPAPPDGGRGRRTA
jgi:double-stranded uracil-DNA glycosylase